MRNARDVRRAGQQLSHRHAPTDVGDLLRHARNGPLQYRAATVRVRNRSSPGPLRMSAIGGGTGFSRLYVRPPAVGQGVPHRRELGLEDRPSAWMQPVWVAELRHAVT